MALRAEIGIGALLIAALVLPSVAQSATYDYEVRHQHWRKGVKGMLHVTPDSIVFEETGKERAHSRTWSYTDIQQLTLARSSIRILTYEDQKWELGRDREYVFDQLPEAAADVLQPLFRAQLDQRFIAELPDVGFQPLWQLPVKLQHGRGGSQGRLLVGADRVVYETTYPGDSRTWTYRDIQNVSSSGQYDLSLMSAERAGLSRSNDHEFHFQLKQALNEKQYDDLWRRVNLSHGLQVLSSGMNDKEGSH